MRKLLAFLVLTISTVSAWATHNRAGEITYKHISGSTYEITVTTYTKASSEPADRCELEVEFGDGDTDTIPRVNGNPDLGCPHGGELLPNNIRYNVYQTVHTYPGPGQYIIKMNDPNRNADVLNIPNSVNTSFYLESMLLISPFGGDNCSPELTNPPIDNGCVFTPFLHNPGAVDADGDVLEYSIVPSLGENGAAIPDYSYPDQVQPGPDNVLSIEPTTGTLIWDSPQQQGEYNVAIRIDEYRNGQLIGYVVRDLQITIQACSNQQPQIVEIEDVCVTAGDTLDFEVKAYDPDQELVELEATGEPFLLDNPATFVETNSTSDTARADFEWITECSNVRALPYQVVVKAQDNNGQFTLVDFKTVKITVVSPPPLDPDAQPSGNGIQVSWTPTVCDNAVGYLIYRSIDSIGYVAPECVTGVPASTGYSLVDSVSGWNTTAFLDNNKGVGLSQGQTYCYMVVAYFEDGAQSYPSLEVCAELKKDLPVPTRVSVNVTDAAAGSDTVTWAAPTELDPVQWPGPYTYKLYRTEGLGIPNELVATFGPTANVFDLDTAYRVEGLNTQDTIQNYRLELLSGGTSVGFSQFASSIFLRTESFDNAVELEWEVQVPWQNDYYVLYRFDNNASDWAVVDTVTGTSYRDNNLVNEREYCYFVRSFGHYSSPGFIDPIINNSQEVCAVPADREAPCAPGELAGVSDCISGETTLTWTNPNHDCADDVVGYRLYYTPIFGEDFQLLTQFGNAEDTSYFRFSSESVAGCYAVTAVDSFYNESALSDTFCVDNCPVYELPNVFTPGGDGYNDFLVPFPYRYVARIDLNIYNRWGNLVFQTNDPAIGWDGMHKARKVLVPAGVYYYTCTVYEIRLTGIEERLLKGYIQLIHEDAPGRPN